MSDYKRINISVEEDDLEHWDQYVGQGGRYASRSGFVRQAVRNEINRIESDSGNDSAIDTETVENLQTTLQGLSHSIQRIENQQDNTVEKVDQVIELTSGTELPVNPRAAVRATVPVQSELNEEREGYTPSEIANRLDGDLDTVREILKELHQANPRIYKTKEMLKNKIEGKRSHTVYYEAEADT